MSGDIAALVERLKRDATCMTAWANGMGPYPQTVRGVSAKHAERAMLAATALTDLQARLEAAEAENAKLRGERDTIVANRRINDAVQTAIEHGEITLDAEGYVVPLRARATLGGEHG